MEYFGYTQATNALSGMTIKGFFVVASKWDESRKVIGEHPFLLGCMTTDEIIMAAVNEFSDSSDNHACQVDSVTATELRNKFHKFEFQLGNTQKLVISDSSQRKPLAIKDGKIRFLAESKNGEIKVGTLDVSNFSAKKDIDLFTYLPIDLKKIDPNSPDTEHLAACYPELADEILPKQIFTKQLDEEYSF